VGIRNYSNEARPLSLSSRAESDDDQIFVNAPGTGDYPEPPFLLAAERGTNREEIMLCTAKTTNSFTVSRGFDGTDPVTHESGSPIEHTVAAIDFREANQHVNDDEHHWTPGDMKMVAYPVTAGNEDPGWLLCDGRTVSQTTYADLYERIQTSYNTGGEGAGNFRLPDLRQAFPMGKAAAGTGAVLGAQSSNTGGTGKGGYKDGQIFQHTHPLTENNHEHGPGAHSHSTPELTHSLSVSDPGHNHVASPSDANVPVEQIAHKNALAANGLRESPVERVTFSALDNSTTGISVSATKHNAGTTSGPSANNTGGAKTNLSMSDPTGSVTVADRNLPPFQTFNFLIKV